MEAFTGLGSQKGVSRGTNITVGKKNMIAKVRYAIEKRLMINPVCQDDTGQQWKHVCVHRTPVL